MSYAVRNSVILAVLLVLVAGAGIYWTVYRKPREIEALEVRQRTLENQISVAAAALSRYEEVLAQLSVLDSTWQRRRGEGVPADESPNVTLSYLDELVRRTDRQINFDITHRGRGDKALYSLNTFVVNGEAHFETLHAFLWLLEHGPRKYAVDRLQIEYKDTDRGAPEKRNWVSFSVILRAYITPKSPLDAPVAAEVQEEFVRPPGLARNLFAPLITRGLPPNVAGLPVVEGARLKIVTHDMVYLEDRSRKMHMLRQGDPVYLGRLESIDVMRNQAVFQLNKGGIVEWVTLRIEEGDARR